MSFASPFLLILLVPVLGLVWYIGWPRQRFRRSRDITSLILRTTIVTLLVFAVAGLQLVRAVDRLSVIFLVDASDSIVADLRDAQLDYIREAVASKPPDDEWAVIVFGGDVSIDKPLSNVTEVNPLRSTVLGSNTNLAEAIQTAISLFPADARRRIVILSDGRQTIGDAEAKARLAEASGVEISYVPLASRAEPDVRIVELDSPARVSEGQEFDVAISIEAEAASQGTLRLFSDGQLIQEQDVNLQEGINNYSIVQRSNRSGFLNFSAQIVVTGGSDSFIQNNELGTFSQVVGPARVLLVASDPQDVVHLIPALENAGVQLDVVEANQLPQDTSLLAPYKSVILVNLPATDLSDQQMERLDSYVKDLGGGLLFIGGPDSYGPGGYFQTPLERTLPVETQIRDQQRIPQLTIVYLVDRSGSMAASGNNTFSNLQLAQRAINLSIDLLQPMDRAAIGTFDSSGAWVAPFQEVRDKRRLQELVDSLRPGGGTDILAGMRLVERDIVNEPSERKHIILLTDGGSSPNGLLELTEQLNNALGVTVSVVAIGQSPPRFLERMSQVGQGRFHVVSDVGQIPNIFAQETVLATRSYIEEGDFTLIQSANSPIMQGITALPSIDGYVATTAKTTAQVVLRGPEPFSDPLLATWQYGLGRAVAYTGDATSRWSTDWVTWEGFSRFWSQAINWTITETSENNIEARVFMDDERARVVLDARDDDGHFLNNLALQTSLITPDNNTETITLQQTAPGRYEAAFVPEREGPYFLGINGGGVLASGEAITVNEVIGWVMSYSPEYVRTDPNERLLADMAALTGGSSLQEDPAAAFAITQEPRMAAAPVWPFLLMAALLLFPFDIGVRRLVITRSDLKRLRQHLFARDTNAAPDERISSLLGARERARERTQMDEQDMSAVAALRRTRENRAQAEAEAPIPPAAQSAQPRQPRRKAADDKPGREGSTIDSLLKRKRGDDADTQDE